MDWNEIEKGLKYRHPWELSRTKMVSQILKSEIRPITESEHRFIDIGAGDMFFDKNWMKICPNSVCYAVDIGYGQDISKRNDLMSKEQKYYSIEQIREKEFDYILMLDSLEYFEDEVEYVNQIKEYLKDGGYILFLVPAFSKLYSEHDRHAKLLRRYDYKELKRIVSEVKGLELCYDQYFYFSLLVIRTFQKLFKLKIDPQEKMTTGWKYSDDNLITKIVVWWLNFDFKVQTLFRKIGIRIPGLSILMLCRKAK